jgi:Na+/H+ antiporter NhaB
MTGDPKSTWRISAFIVLISIVSAVGISIGSFSIYRAAHAGRERRDQQSLVNAQVHVVLEEQRAALRSILCLAEGIVLQNKTLTGEQLRQALVFYTQALALIHAQPCSIQRD